MNYSFKRTQWGRSMAAVGGNREAARPDFRTGFLKNRWGFAA